MNDRQIMDTGLRGVKVARTRISHVDGTAGKLIYRGYVISDLAEKTTFEEIVHLLLYESLPDPGRLADFKKQLAAERDIAPAIIGAMRALSLATHPMEVLQAMVPLLAVDDAGAASLDRDVSVQSAVKLVAKLPTVMAAWNRIRNNEDPVAPDPALSHAANFLYMMTGRQPDEAAARFFDVCLVLHAEHSFNASTFSARQVASTRAHIYAAVSAAVGSLSGELHGGANTRVMQMLMKIGSLDAVDAYIKDALENGGRIMGLGHAVYKTGDPRVKVLQPMSRRLSQMSGDTLWYDLSVALEEKGKAAFKEKTGQDIFPNVDFYSATVYHYLGIPTDLFTPMFAISRVSGWCAHVIEEQFGGAGSKPALYRPSAEYTGEYCGPDECAFVPLDKR